MTDRVNRFSRKSKNYFKRIASPTTSSRYKTNLKEYKTQLNRLAEIKPKRVIADMAVTSKNLLTPSLLNQIPTRKIDEKLIRYFDVPNLDTKNQFEYFPKERTRNIQAISNSQRRERQLGRDYYANRKELRSNHPLTTELKKLQEDFYTFKRLRTQR